MLNRFKIGSVITDNSGRRLTWLIVSDKTPHLNKNYFVLLSSVVEIIFWYKTDTSEIEVLFE